jgi:hypothetical protein
MSRRSIVMGAALATAAAGCVKITDNETTVLSLEFVSLASPSVVLGDSLRDTTGVVVPPVVRAFNYRGEEITAPPLRFHSPDPGISVDSITGVIIGDSLRSTAARVIATLGSLQAVRLVDVALRPDSIAALDGRDTLEYSVLDSTRNVSEQLTVELIHGIPPADSAVRSYVISFAVVSGGNPLAAELVNGAKASTIDTTDASGAAGRALRIRPVYLDAAVDSVIVNATVKYRGALVAGSPVRLVLVVRPIAP